MAKKDERDNEFDEPTPTHQGFPITDAEWEVIQLYTTVKGMLLRDFYADAYVKEAEARAEWEGRNSLERYPWLAYPTGERRSAVTYQRHVRELEKWAARDNIKKAFAHYTAVYHRVLEAREELKELGHPLRLSPYEEDKEE